MTLWYEESIDISSDLVHTNCLKHGFNLKHNFSEFIITKMIIYTKDPIESYLLQINGCDQFDRDMSTNMNSIYQYNNQVILDNDTYAMDLHTNIISPKDRIQLNLWSGNHIIKTPIKIMFQIKTGLFYAGGMASFRNMSVDK